MPAAKSWVHSKTLWFNSLTLLVLIVSLVAANAGVLALDPRIVVILGIAVTVINAALRLVTNVAISGTPAASSVVAPAPAPPAPAP